MTEHHNTSRIGRDFMNRLYVGMDCIKQVKNFHNPYPTETRSSLVVNERNLQMCSV